MVTGLINGGGDVRAGRVCEIQAGELAMKLSGGNIVSLCRLYFSRESAQIDVFMIDPNARYPALISLTKSDTLEGFAIRLPFLIPDVLLAGSYAQVTTAVVEAISIAVIYGQLGICDAKNETVHPDSARSSIRCDIHALGINSYAAKRRTRLIHAHAPLELINRFEVGIINYSDISLR